MTILSPLNVDEVHELVDVLELTALFSREKAAYVDSLIGALDIGEDHHSEVIDQSDEGAEETSARIADEIKSRAETLGSNAYPFRISENGEVLNRLDVLHFGHVAYLIMLLINNSWAGGKLDAPLKLTPAEERSARNVFEVVSAVAAVGYADGPSFLIGTNRGGAEALLRRLAKVAQVANEGKARSALHPDAPRDANDDGVDIIAISPEVDNRPPVRGFFLAQSASGANYVNKPIKNLVDSWMDLWFEQKPANPCVAVVFVPAIMSPRHASYYARLGQMVHRVRLGHYAAKGADMVAQNPDLLNFVDDLDQPSKWIASYAVRTGAAL